MNLKQINKINKSTYPLQKYLAFKLMKGVIWNQDDDSDAMGGVEYQGKFIFFIILVKYIYHTYAKPCVK